LAGCVSNGEHVAQRSYIYSIYIYIYINLEVFMEHTFSLDSIYWELAHFSALTPDSKANNITSKSLQTSSGNNEIYTNSQPQCFFKIPQEK